jgi:hypothetical protein
MEGEFMVRRLSSLAALAAIFVLVAVPAALAHSCVNVSRAPAACGMTCTEPVFAGKWVWLPSVGVPFAAWGMEKPGNAGDSLLEQSAVCTGQGNAADARQGGHGIQTGC